MHVLTQTGISVKDEFGLQFYLLGNGKRSLYLFFGVLLGAVFYVNHFNFFVLQYKRGKSAHCYYHLDFLKLLDQPIDKLRNSLAII
jgi:hypothetical protein